VRKTGLIEVGQRDEHQDWFMKCINEGINRGI
jgi:hypothetical protein